jgi:catechol 2,3-dioxygenase-like lactoylglutathione lyase family enzyme
VGAGILLLLVGCASGSAGNPFSDYGNTDTFVLRVESRYIHQVSIYANPSGKRHLVGEVPANGLEFFDFEYPAGLPLNLELEGRMGDRYRMPATPFLGGGRVDLIIASELRRSEFVRR